MPPPPSPTHRWNIEQRGAELLVCRGEHDKHEGCQWERFVLAALPSDGLREALVAWQAFDAEAADLNPCPDYTLRRRLRERARELTDKALSVLPVEGGGEQEQGDEKTLARGPVK